MVGEPPELGFEPRDHLEIGTRLGLIDMESAARASGSRFAYLKGDLVRLELALVQFAFAKLAPHGFLPGRAARAGARGAALLDRVPADRPGSDIRDQRRRPLPGGHLRGEPGRPPRGGPAGRGRRCRSATRASRPASGARPGRPGATRAGSSGSTSSTRSRCSRSCGPRTPATSTSGCWRSRRRSCGDLEIPYRVVNVAAGDLGASAAKKYDCEAWLPGPGPLPGADVVLEHDRLPGAPPARPLPARRRRLAAPGPHPQRDGRRGRPHDHRDHGEPPDAPTAAWSCRRRWLPSAPPSPDCGERRNRSLDADSPRFQERPAPADQ